MVKIETDNTAFEKILEDLKFDEPGALLKGTNLIGNNAMQGIFEIIDLKETDGSPKKTPQAGATTYTFPIGAFFTFLDMFAGTHKFQLTVTDNNDQQVTDTITITITE